MQLERKADLEKVLQRFDAWWNCDMLDRPLLTIPTKATKQPKLPEKQHASPREKWFDLEYRIENFEASLEGAVFLAETVPSFQPDLGPDLAATLFGAELEFGEKTIWSKPTVASCREIIQRQPDLENEYWTAVRKLTDLSIERGAGKWLTGITDLHASGDAVAALRGMYEICLEIADDVDAVRAACDHISRFYPMMYNDLYQRIAAANQPITTWTPILDTKRANMVQCDFICLIGPEMFQNAVLPAIVEEMQFLDRCMFHLDGAGSLAHLDTFLELDEMNALQWVYGEGNGPSTKWMDVYKRAQQAGKALQLTPEDFDAAKAMAEQLRPEGVWFCFETSPPQDRQDVEAFIKWLESWAAGKKG